MLQKEIVLLVLKENKIRCCNFSIMNQIISFSFLFDHN